jgi:hypothetical protein
MDPANSTFQIAHVNNAQAVVSTKSGKIDYNGASPIRPNEATVFFRGEGLSPVSVRPSAMACDPGAGDRDHV